MDRLLPGAGKKTDPSNESDALSQSDPTYGDRINKIVFIGRDMDKAAIIKALDHCLAQ